MLSGECRQGLEGLRREACLPDGMKLPLGRTGNTWELVRLEQVLNIIKEYDDFN